MSTFSERLRGFWWKWKKELVLVFLLILVSSVSFAAGYLLARKGISKNIIIELSGP